MQFYWIYLLIQLFQQTILLSIIYSGLSIFLRSALSPENEYETELQSEVENYVARFGENFFLLLVFWIITLSLSVPPNVANKCYSFFSFLLGLFMTIGIGLIAAYVYYHS